VPRKAKTINKPDPVFVETPLNQTRTAFFEELASQCDLTADKPVWSGVLKDPPAIILLDAIQAG
jgi:hypothetical protein